MEVIDKDGKLIEIPLIVEPNLIFDTGSSKYSKPKKNITKAQRIALRSKFGGRCAYCGCQLPEKGWHADHVEPVRRDFDVVRAPGKGYSVARSNGKVLHPELHAIENLFPACAPCNLFKATWTIEDMRNEISKQAERARAYSVNFRTAERFGLVEVVQKPVIFWFEIFDESIDK